MPDAGGTECLLSTPLTHRLCSAGGSACAGPVLSVVASAKLASVAACRVLTDIQWACAHIRSSCKGGGAQAAAEAPSVHRVSAPTRLVSTAAAVHLSDKLNQAAATMTTHLWSILVRVHVRPQQAISKSTTSAITPVNTRAYLSSCVLQQCSKRRLPVVKH